MQMLSMYIYFFLWHFWYANISQLALATESKAEAGGSALGFEVIMSLFGHFDRMM